MAGRGTTMYKTAGTVCAGKAEKRLRLSDGCCCPTEQSGVVQFRDDEDKKNSQSESGKYAELPHCQRHKGHGGTGRKGYG